jgi:predicted Zn-ribbon and HTH transcriptional regulator
VSGVKRRKPRAAATDGRRNAPRRRVQPRYSARCQFCGYHGTGWIKDTCPRCKRTYDYMLAQEGDD